MQKNIGNIIKTGREKKKISQKQLAEMMDVHQTHISQWESGTTRIHGEALLEIAKILDITEELFSHSRHEISEHSPEISRLLERVKKLENQISSWQMNKNLMRELQILIVEDDITTSLVVQETFDVLGINCFQAHANYPEQGIKILEKNTGKKTCLIVLDISTSEHMSAAMDFLKKVSSPKLKDKTVYYCSIPTIVVMGLKNAHIQKITEFDGVFGVLRKPFGIDEFSQILTKINLSWPLKPKKNLKKAKRKNPRINLLEEL